MKLQATDFLLRSIDVEIRPLLRDFNRASKQARERRRPSKLRDRLAMAVEWGDRESGRVGK